jgi:hypothetical protein
MATLKINGQGATERRPAARAITEAVQALIGDSPERQAAARIRDEIAAMPSSAEVVPALVDLAS